MQCFSSGAGYTSPSRGEGGAPSLSPASILLAISGQPPEGLSDRGAPGGGDRPTRVTVTPTRNAIGLSLPVSRAARDAIGKLSPWRSVLPPQGGGRNGGHSQNNHPVGLHPSHRWSPPHPHGRLVD